MRISIEWTHHAKSKHCILRYTRRFSAVGYINALLTYFFQLIQCLNFQEVLDTQILLRMHSLITCMNLAAQIFTVLLHHFLWGFGLLIDHCSIIECPLSYIQGSQLSRIRRETHAIQPMHTLTRHTSYFSRREITRIATNQFGPLFNSGTGRNQMGFPYVG